MAISCCIFLHACTHAVNSNSDEMPKIATVASAVAMPTKSDGLNVVHGKSAVLVRPQINRSDDLLKKDAVLNAEELVLINPKVTVMHLIYGTTAHQHLYKRIDVTAKDLRLVSANPNSLKITQWDSQADGELPGYTENPKHYLEFADDPEHCGCGTMSVGSYDGADGGSLLLARNEVDVQQHRLQKFDNDSMCLENAKPYEVLRAQFERAMARQKQPR